MSSTARLEAARAEFEERARAERASIETELNALLERGVRPGSNDARREKWLRVRLRCLEKAMTTADGGS